MSSIDDPKEKGTGSFLHQFADQAIFIARRKGKALPDNRFTKVPVDIATNKAFNGTVPENGYTLAEVRKYLAEHPEAGLGIILDGTWLACADLDKVRNPVTGEINPEAMRLVQALESPTTISSSGTGLHIWLGLNPKINFDKDDLKRIGITDRLYRKKCFIALTENFLPDLPPQVVDKTRVLLSMIESGGALKSSDERLQDALPKMMKSKGFPERWAGKYLKNEQGVIDHTANHQGLCNVLAQHAHSVDEVLEWFSRSEMSDGHWNDRTESYRRRTAEKAFNDMQVTLEVEGGYALTDIGDGQRFVDEHGENVRYMKSIEKWFVWDGMRFLMSEKEEYVELAKRTAIDFQNKVDAMPFSEEKKRIQRHATRMQSGGGIEAMLKSARSDPKIAIAKHELDTGKWLINVQNGTVELCESGEYRLRDHRREDLITKVTPVRYDPEAKCPTWMKFLNDTFAGDEELIRYVQQFVGYSLIGTTFLKVIAICYGGPNTGKTTFVETIHKLFGDQYSFKIPADFFMQNNNRNPDLIMASLIGVRFAYASEADQGKKLAEARIKEMTGNDRLQARAHYQMPMNYEPSHTLWLATNHLPVVSGNDEATWLRMRVIPFDHAVPKEQLDLMIMQKFERELDGIFMWALEGFRDVMQNGLLSPQVVIEAIEEYHADNDPVQTWFDEEIEITNDPKDRIASSALFLRYDAWRQLFKQPQQSQKALGTFMTNKGFPSVKTSKAGVSHREYRGVTFKFAGDV